MFACMSEAEEADILLIIGECYVTTSAPTAVPGADDVTVNPKSESLYGQCFEVFVFKHSLRDGFNLKLGRQFKNSYRVCL